MNATTSTLCSIVIACVVGLSTAVAAPSEDKASKAPSSAKTVAAAPRPGYEPPLRGAPKSDLRVESRGGGGTRGAGGMPTLEVVAPEHNGSTAQPQPSLQWYVADAGAARMEVTLITDAEDEPLLEVEVDPVAGAGVQSLDLADHGIRLQPGVEYRWFVAIIPDPGQRSKDTVAGGTLRYVGRPAV